MHIKENEFQFISNCDVHSYNTSNKGNLQEPFSRLALCKNSPNNMGIMCFNKIRSHIKTNRNKTKFKSYNFSYATAHFIQ